MGAEGEGGVLQMATARVATEEVLPYQVQWCEWEAMA